MERTPTLIGKAGLRSLPWALPAAIVVALMAPMVLTDRSFGVDWAGHLWLVGAQTNNVDDIGHPSYFVQSGLGAFYPWFAFYGGTLYGAVGTVASLLGDRVIAVYVASFALAFVVALGGMTWLARQAGLRGWLASVPGLAYVTSAYYVTDVYARGAWPETVAISALPLVVAGGMAIVRAPRLGVGPAAAVIVGAAVVAGSHNITLVWGALVLLALAAVAVVAAGRDRAPVARRLGLVAGLFAVGVGIDLWFLLIPARLHGDVPIGRDVPRPTTRGLGVGDVISPFRFSLVGASAPTFDVQIPTLLLAWSAVAVRLARPRADLLRRFTWGLGLLLVPLLVLLLVQSTWAAVPHLLWLIQFPYRLDAYVALIAAGLLALALVALRDASRATRVRLLLALGLLLAIETGQSVAQAWRTPSHVGDRGSVLHPGPPQAPPWWEVFSVANEFGDVGARVVRPTITSIPGATSPGGAPIVTYTGQLAQTLSLPVDRRPVRSSYEFRFVAPQVGDLLTNVVGSPRLVAVSGATPVGRTADSRMIVRLPRPGPTHLVFSSAHNRAVVAGWIGSLLSLAIALALLVALALRGRSSRRA